MLITDGTDSPGRSSARFDAVQRLLATDISVHVLSYTSMEIASIEPRTKNTTNLPPKQALPDEVVNQLRFGRGVDSRLLKATGFRYGYTTRETVLKLGEHLRLAPVISGVEQTFY